MGIFTLENKEAFVLDSFMQDFSTALNSVKDSYVEISFARPSTSSFNSAFYFNAITPQHLANFTNSDQNVSFLNGCKNSVISVQTSVNIQRAGNNECVLEKNILSFDLDFKDFIPGFEKFLPKEKLKCVKEQFISISKKIEEYNLPIWFIVYSGNGLHFHFRVDVPLNSSSEAYNVFYKSALGYLECLFELPLDPRCCNPGRLMRLPFSTNFKDPKNPVKTQIFYYDSNAKADTFFSQFSNAIITSKKSYSTKDKSQLLDKLTLDKVLTFFDYSKSASIKESPNKILCSSPFTEDKTPSFYYCKDKKLFYDFSSGQGGDLYTLIAKLANLDTKKDFKTVLQYAKKILGIPTEESINQGSYTLKDSGVWFLGAEDEGLWVSSYIEVIGYTRDIKNEAWGRLLLIKDDDGKEKTWSMSMDYLAGEGLELRKKLLSLGVVLNSARHSRSHLIQYLLMAKPTEKLRSVSRIGWFDNSYVFPEGIYSSTTKEKIVFQSQIDCSLYSTKGELKDWQHTIGQFCEKNSRLLLALCSAFAPPLLFLTGNENFGIHLVGTSSIGKTVALTVAGSVWGGGKLHGYKSRWRTTTNGLEGLAVKHNDSLLVLDELGEVSPYDAGSAAYMLANGSGKVRSSKEGSMREPEEWRLIFLSAGEIDLTTHMESVGEKTRAGQEVRMVSIEADAGNNLGLFEEIHSFASSAELADHLRIQCLTYYGTPIRAFIEKLVCDSEIYRKFQTSRDRFKQSLQKISYGGQILRIIDRFALLNFAGELACEYKILPFEHLHDAMGMCLQNWIQAHSSSVNIESEMIISQIREYLQKYGISRFPEMDETQITPNQHAGFRKRQENGQFDWFIFNEVFRKEICHGFDLRQVTKILSKEKLLVACPYGKNSKTYRLPLVGLTRIYQLSGAIMSH